MDDINTESLTVLDAVAEPAIISHEAERFQFERQGYFYQDVPSADGTPIFNKTVSLREGF